ncbi:transketolase C-terminal domain-containing protein, partial [Natrialba taiwanensis]
AGVGAEIAATIQEEALLYQQAPIRRVTGYDVPMPLHELEEYYLPQAIRIEEAIRETVSF